MFRGRFKRIWRRVELRKVGSGPPLRRHSVLFQGLSLRLTGCADGSEAAGQQREFHKCVHGVSRVPPRCSSWTSTRIRWLSCGAERCGEAACKRWEFQKPRQLLEKEGGEGLNHFQPRETQNSKSEMPETEMHKADGCSCRLGDGSDAVLTLVGFIQA